MSRFSTMKSGMLDKTWEQTQIKVFSRWADKHLHAVGESCQDITKELSDGIKLIKLLEVVGKDPIKAKWHKAVKVRFQALENASVAIDYITKEKGVKLVGIGPNDIVDCNSMLTLGLVWSVINKFLIEDISVEEATARDALLLWCQKNTQGYEGVNIVNFRDSWSSGLGFCALINHFRPDKLDYNALDKADHTHNCVAAFDACRDLGISVYLDPEDLVGVTPDDKSVVLQVLQFFHYFAADSKIDAMASKIARAVKIQREIAELVDEFTALAKEALAAMAVAKDEIEDDSFDHNITGTKAKLVDVIGYGKTTRPDIYGKKSKAGRTWNAMILKCKSTGRNLPQPPEGITYELLEEKFQELDKTVEDRRTGLLQELKAKSQDYVARAKDVIASIEAVETFLHELAGTDEEKRVAVLAKEPETEQIAGIITDLTPAYEELESAEMHLEIIETPSVLTSAMVNLQEHIQLLIGQIDSNIAAAKGLEVSEEQLKDYRETFNHFDKDKSATLVPYELNACLRALGEDCTEEECKEICAKYSNGGEEIEFEAYVKFMLDRFRKDDSAESTREAFKAVCQEAGFITDAQLERFFAPEDVEYLKATLQPVEGGYAYGDWIDQVYA